MSSKIFFQTTIYIEWDAYKLFVIFIRTQTRSLSIAFVRSNRSKCSFRPLVSTHGDHMISCPQQIIYFSSSILTAEKQRVSKISLTLHYNTPISRRNLEGCLTLNLEFIYISEEKKSEVDTVGVWQTRIAHESSQWPNKLAEGRRWNLLEIFVVFDIFCAKQKSQDLNLNSMLRYIITSWKHVRTEMFASVFLFLSLCYPVKW